LRRNNRAFGSLPYRTKPPPDFDVILSKRSLRGEGSERAARCVAFFATQ
jgi:hypothetical protein